MSSPTPHDIVCIRVKFAHLHMHVARERPLHRHGLWFVVLLRCLHSPFSNCIVTRAPTPSTPSSSLPCSFHPFVYVADAFVTSLDSINGLRKWMTGHVRSSWGETKRGERRGHVSREIFRRWDWAAASHKCRRVEAKRTNGLKRS